MAGLATGSRDLTRLSHQYIPEISVAPVDVKESEPDVTRDGASHGTTSSSLLPLS